MASTVINIPSSGDNDPQQPLLAPATAAAAAPPPAENDAAAPLPAQNDAAAPPPAENDPAAPPPAQNTAAAPAPAQNTAFQSALRTTAGLANFLPTGTILTFELFSPFATDGGVCSPTNQYITATLIALCSLSGFVLSFSDSFTDETGDVRYGFVTLTGLAVLEGAPLPPEKAGDYKLTGRDVVHGFMSLMIFAGVALLDRNVVSCFVPDPTPLVERVLSVLPVAIALLCSILFVIFPNNRNGIGFPVSRR